jgi:hypothetical protein
MAAGAEITQLHEQAHFLLRTLGLS